MVQRKCIFFAADGVSALRRLRQAAGAAYLRLAKPNAECCRCDMHGEMVLEVCSRYIRLSRLHILHFTVNVQDATQFFSVQPVHTCEQ
jgi:hypothetical protein